MLEERRARHEANRAVDHGEGVTRYRMRQKMFAIGNDYWIDDEAGDHVYKVDGKALRLRHTFKIEDADGHRVAMVKKALIGPVHDRWRIKQENGPELTVHGNIVDHVHTIERDGFKVAEVSKKWFRIRDTYGLDIDPDADHATVLAATMSHPGD